MSCKDLSLIAPLLLLTSCGPVNRGLDTVHQPVVDRGMAYVPGCPDWSYGGATEDLQEATSANYGCATATNLAAMIADPNDLLVGKTSPETGRDPAQAERAVDRWLHARWKPFGWAAAYGDSGGSGGGGEGGAAGAPGAGAGEPGGESK